MLPCSIALGNQSFYKEMVDKLKTGPVDNCRFRSTEENGFVDINMNIVDEVEFAKHLLSGEYE